MRLSTISTLALTCAIDRAIANVEKAIFIAPETISIPQRHPILSDLHIAVLTPLNTSLRAYFTSSFPNDEGPLGTATWVLLKNLIPSQRYEVRICWAATVTRNNIPCTARAGKKLTQALKQPTAFTLDTYEPSKVMETPELISSLAQYSSSPQAGPSTGQNEKREVRRGQVAQEEPREDSVLFLRILAAADYFTDDAALMGSVPPVYADVILDPYLLNILPKSLIPTVAYLLAVALVSWPVAKLTASHLQRLSQNRDQGDKKNK